MVKHILRELKIHAPFTLFGAVTGIVILIISLKLPYGISYNIFYILHPLHVLLSALVTASMYKLHRCERTSIRCLRGKCNLYLGEVLLKMLNRGIHLGFIEKWWLVNPLAYYRCNHSLFQAEY